MTFVVQRKPTRIREAPIDSEYGLHKWTVQQLRAFARPDVRFWHTANEGKVSNASIGKRGAMGVSAGIPDLEIWINGDCHFLELKWGKNDLSIEQREFFAWAQNHRIPCEVARTQDQVMSILEEWNAVRPSGWQFRGHSSAPLLGGEG